MANILEHIPRVGFIVAGTQKGATTSLHQTLNQHDEIQMAVAKELHFFNKDKYFKWPLKILRKRYYLAYERNFISGTSNKIWGETTPDYMYIPEVAHRVCEYNPDMKWIIVLRHPVYRAFSSWNMMRSRQPAPRIDKERMSFADALKGEANRLKSVEHRIAYGYLDRSCYSEQIRRIHRYFGIDNVFVTTSPKFRLYPEKVAGEICEFLGVRQFVATPTALNCHAGNYVDRCLDRELFAQITRELRHEIEETSRLTMLDLTPWTDPGYDERHAGI